MATRTKKSELRGTKTKLTILQNRAWTVLEYLDAYVRPKLKGHGVKKYDEAVGPLKNSMKKLGWVDE